MDPWGDDVPIVHVDNFSYGLLNPVLGYLMSCVGAFIGLRCVTRARGLPGPPPGAVAAARRRFPGGDRYLGDALHRHARLHDPRIVYR